MHGGIDCSLRHLLEDVMQFLKSQAHTLFRMYFYAYMYIPFIMLKEGATYMYYNVLGVRFAVIPCKQSLRRRTSDEMLDVSISRSSAEMYMFM